MSRRARVVRHPSSLPWTEPLVRDPGEIDPARAPCVARESAVRAANESASGVVIIDGASIVMASPGAPRVSPPTPCHAASFRDA